MINTSVVRRIYGQWHPRISLLLLAAGLILVGITGGIAALAPAPILAAAGVNKTIGFQGRLLSATGAVVPDGNYNLKFKIYQDGPGNVAGDTGGTLMWTELWQNSVATGSSSGVTVKNGYFSVTLGTYCVLAGSSCQGNSNTGVSFNQDTLWLSMDVGGTAVSNTPTYDGEMLPMKRLTSAVYALQADNANSLGGLTSSQFIQNTTTVQTNANINILSGAATTVAAAQIQTVASATAPVLILKGGATPGAGADLLQVQSSSAILSRFDSSGNLTFSGTTARTITGPGTGGLTVGVTSGPLTVSTTTSGTLAITSAGVLSLTGAAASTWTLGANALTLTSSNFSIDPSTERLTIGPSGGDTTGTLTVLGNKTTTGDPTGVEGALYYNSYFKIFRCYHDGAWSGCDVHPIDREWVVEDEFWGGLSATGITNGGIGGFGQLGWNASTIPSSSSAGSSVMYNDGSLLPSADHPGIMHVSTNTSGTLAANNGMALSLGNPSGATTGNGASWVLSPNGNFKITAAVGSSTSNTVLFRTGLVNDFQTLAAGGAGTSGLYWEADPGTNANWRYCYIDGSNVAQCAASGVAVAANTFVRLEIRLTALGSGTSAATFLINGTASSVSSVTINTTNRVSPDMVFVSHTTAVQDCYIDYVQATGVVSSSSAR